MNDKSSSSDAQKGGFDEAAIKQFWEHKILGWEQGRYVDQDAGATPLERFANRASRSLRFRIHVTEQILTPVAKGRRILEIGCGSGLLAGPLMKAGATSYRGIDIAEAAIDIARERAVRDGLPETVSFEVGSVADLDARNADLVFSLGLLDWLSYPELDTLFDRTRGADFLHAISERRLSLSQWIHRAYCYVSYGYRTAGYVPRYHRVAEIEERCRVPVQVYRDPRLSFGALVTTLPLPGDV